MSSTAKILAILGICLGVIVLIGMLIVAVDRLLVDPLAVSLNMPWIANIPLVAICLGAVMLLPGRWTAIPKRIEVRGEIDIAATPQVIWNVISPRQRDTYWRAFISHTTLDPDDPDRITFHFGGTDDIFARTPLQAVIHAEVPDEYFAYRYLNAGSFPGMAADLELSEYFLEEMPGGTRVTEIEHLRRIRLLSIPQLLFRNPARDALRRLKTLVEGGQDPSWMGLTARQLAEDEG